jgi:hypothetical protein
MFATIIKTIALILNEAKVVATYLMRKEILLILF